MVSYRTALGRARGLGSAKHGVGHWIVERVSSVALVPLSLWGAFSALNLARVGFDGASLWLHSPVNAVLAGQGIGLHRKDRQAPARRPSPSPQVQQGQDVQARAEAGLGHGEAPPPGPGLWQAAAVQKDGPGLVQAALAGEVDVVEDAGAGRAVRGPVEFGAGGSVGHGPG